MKKFNGILITVIFLYICFAAAEYAFFWNAGAKEGMRYKVEINEIMKELERTGSYTAPDLQNKSSVQEVDFLAAQEGENADFVQEFFRSRNGTNSAVRPLFVEGKLLGLIRFDYVSKRGNENLLLMEGITAVLFLLLFSVLLYIKIHIVKPFTVLSEMPYELSKGHLQGELEESRSRFFGKFVWGISMLRDTLQAARKREQQLEKEKKLLLLSLSHDTRIPLSAIKLYAKALRENMYPAKEERDHAAGQIERHVSEIEEFVEKIVTASSEDIFDIEVNYSEFYLKEYMDKVTAYYEPRCRLMMTQLQIATYHNKLIRGDLERAFEVMENLFENALKYGDGKRIVVDFYEEDYCQIIRIFNTGCVVAAEEMPHLFDSFFRGSNVENKDGNGLGLYIGRQIMRKMEGDIFAQRQADGMSFCLVFRM